MQYSNTAVRSSSAHGPPRNTSARMSSFSSAPIASRPCAVSAPMRPLPAGTVSPLVPQRNSAHRSRTRSGMGQPNARWQPSSAEAIYATNKLSTPVGYGGSRPNSSRQIRISRPLRSSRAQRQTGTGRSPAPAMNSKSASQISRYGQRSRGDITSPRAAASRPGDRGCRPADP